MRTGGRVADTSEWRGSHRRGRASRADGQRAAVEDYGDELAPDGEREVVWDEEDRSHG
jgi:hypothetical protein